jgi:hypothetical protein
MYYIIWIASYPHSLGANRGYQAAETLGDAKKIATMFKRERQLEHVRIVDALDHRHGSGYRLTHAWVRDASRGMRWYGGAASGRVFL